MFCNCRKCRKEKRNSNLWWGYIYRPALPAIVKKSSLVTPCVVKLCSYFTTVELPSALADINDVGIITLRHITSAKSHAHRFCVCFFIHTFINPPTCHDSSDSCPNPWPETPKWCIMTFLCIFAAKSANILTFPSRFFFMHFLRFYDTYANNLIIFSQNPT